jgi:hypothetical protein
MISDLEAKIANDAPPLRRTRSSEHPRADHASAQTRARVSAAIKRGAIYPRSRDEFGRMFAGLELIEPGIVSVSDWRAEIEPELRLCPTETAAYGAVGRLP